jgi:hypothetical protein
MKVTTSPGFRFGWEGTSVEYVVKADGASELVLSPKKLEGVDARLTDIRKTENGVEGRVLVDMRESSFV